MNNTKYRRQLRNRKKVVNQGKPRLSVFRSNKHIFAQIIDDEQRKTLASFNDMKLKDKKGSKSEIAAEVGANLAKLAKKAGVEVVVFDRGAYKYHGRVKALAEAARENGLKF